MMNWIVIHPFRQILRICRNSLYSGETSDGNMNQPKEFRLNILYFFVDDIHEM